jgi:hypothetical protein
MRNGAKTFIIKNDTSNAFGIASFIFGLISIFVLAPLFVPLSILFGVLAVLRKQLAWGVIGLICAFIGFLTSPILLGIVGVASVASVVGHTHTASSSATEAPPQPQVEHFLTTQEPVSSPQRLTVQQASQAATAASIECMNKRLSGELKTHADSVNCSNPNYIEAYQRAAYPYMDLIRLITTERLEVAEKIDANKITEAGGKLEAQKFLANMADIERQRNLENRN